MKKLAIALICLSLFVNCVNKSSSPTDSQTIMMDSTNEAEMALDNYENVFEAPPTVRELNQSLPIIEKLLLENQFHFLSKEKYQNRIKEIFEFDPSFDCHNRIVNFEAFYIYTSPKRDAERGVSIAEIIERTNQMALEDSENLLFAKDKSYITPLFYSIELTDSTYKNPQLISKIIHRNKYLFNGNTASLTWLMSHDSEFVESLVLYYGYVQDKKIVKWVLDKNPFHYSAQDSNLDSFIRILLHKRCNNSIRLNKEALEVMREHLHNDYLEQIIDLIRYYGIQNNDSDFTITLTFSEKAMLIAHLLYWGETLSQEEKYTDYMFQFMGAFYEWSKDRDEYDNEFKKERYYGLKNFQELWEEAKEQGDGMTPYAM